MQDVISLSAKSPEASAALDAPDVDERHITSESDASSSSSHQLEGSLGNLSESDEVSDSHDDEVAGPSAEADRQARQVPTVILEVQEQREVVWQEQDTAGEGPVAPANSSAASTFFAKEIGFTDEAGLAKTGRSRCHHCGNMIGKGEPRFAYHYNCFRPSAWMHGFCVALFIQPGPPARKLQAIERLRSIKSDASTPTALQDAARSILRQLEVTDG